MNTFLKEKSEKPFLFQILFVYLQHIINSKTRNDENQIFLSIRNDYVGDDADDVLNVLFGQ